MIRVQGEDSNEGSIRQELRSLIEAAPGPCVSLYQPTHRAGPKIQQDPIRLKNLLREAEGRLTTMGMRSPEARDLLKPALALADDGLFWRHQLEGLALFLAPGRFHLYSVPLSFDELGVVAERFHLKPLLQLFTGDGGFYILALSQNQVRLLEGWRHGVTEIDLAGAPSDIEEALGTETQEKQRQFHTRAPGGVGPRAAVFHGHGLGGEQTKLRLVRFFRRVDAALNEFLREERAPLVVAGVDYYLPIYREASAYPLLMEEGVPGSPEGVSAEQLHRRAWAIAEPHFARAQKEAGAQYQALQGTGRTSNDVTECVLAAIRGRIGLVFVLVGVQRWGRLSPDGQEVTRHEAREPGDQDLLDLIAVHSLLSGATVYGVEAGQMPDQAPVAAVFRY